MSEEDKKPDFGEVLTGKDKQQDVEQWNQAFSRTHEKVNGGEVDKWIEAFKD